MASPIRSTLQYLGLVDEDHIHPSKNELQVVPATKFLSRPAKQTQHTEAPNEIVTLHPKVYSDAKFIAEHFREGIPVIMNLALMDIKDARRLIDFASGLAQGLHGTIERITSRVFLLSPYSILVTGDEAADTAEVDTTFFRS